MAQERSCPCTDPSLPFPEGTPPHRYICQANKGSPPGAVYQEQEFRTDNGLLRSSSSAQPWEEVKLLWSRPAAHRWVEPVRSDCTAVAAAGIPVSGWEDNSPPSVG